MVTAMSSECDDRVHELEVRLAEERDRRYAEVNIEKEKALKIKETADLAALQLAREIQTYKDEKANELREQINSERGHYSSKDDMRALEDKLTAMIAPLIAYVNSQQGHRQQVDDSRGASNTTATFASIAISILFFLVAVASLVLALTR
jgi:hypothetical protein